MREQTILKVVAIGWLWGTHNLYTEVCSVQRNSVASRDAAMVMKYSIKLYDMK